MAAVKNRTDVIEISMRNRGKRDEEFDEGGGGNAWTVKGRDGARVKKKKKRRDRTTTER